MHVKRRKNLLDKTKGYMWGRKNQIKLATTAVMKAGVHAFVDRRKKKRTNRGLWQIRISAFVREHGLSYSRFIDAIKKAGIGLDRKILADLSANNAEVMAGVVKSVKN